MYIIAGEHNLAILKQNVHRDNGVGLILNIEVDRNSISICDLESIVNDIGDNALGITVYNDNDEKEAILSGFHCEPSIVAKGSVYKVEFINESENTFQIGRQKLMIENLETNAELQAKVINSQSEALIKQEQTISEQKEAFDKQTNQVKNLEEMSAIQLSTLESILLEVIPSIATEIARDITAQLMEEISERYADKEENVENYDDEYYEDELTTEEIIEESTQEPSEETADDSAENSAEKSSDEITEELEDEVGEEIPEETITEPTEEVTDELSETIEE